MTAVANPPTERPGAARGRGSAPVALWARRGSAPVVLALVLVAGTAVFGGRFASALNLGNIALDSSYLLLIAIGMTFVILSGGIDLSVGSLLALSGVLTAYASRWGTPAAILVPLGVCALFGLANGVLVGRARIAPFIVTLAGLLFARGLAFAVSKEGNQVYIIPAELALTRVGQARFLGVGAPVWFALAVFAVALVVLNRSRFGQAVFAIGGSEEAAELMGLPVARVKTLVYVLSAVLTGLAGVLVAAQTQSGLPTIGEGRELEAIAAVVIGGTLLSGGAGSLSGTLAGVLLLKVIQNLINQVGTLTAYYQQVVSGAFLIVVVLVQSRLSRRGLR
ncbi:ABC transporter permease [Phytohabitans aurantiacus]|jgi:ribose/xylose/arabinose/galactoside ABC-type transport system permease subunit|uniref:Sugar ABC transporter permease n=1 Tax=Phytohabitans aurantiacus TaxID=3016789 RepID=A0ABQ5QQH3_9ACTN|nr:ABC transporter permease [Phytohabitans aurantiacus]GLH96484.1 sugar ABC transporter permease [Phytohabitans aurantiacus]